MLPNDRQAIEDLKGLIKRLQDAVPYQGKSAQAFLCHEAAEALLSKAHEAEGLKAEVERLKAPPKEKRAPVQRWPGGIPWDMHLRAYAAYCKKWSPQPALIDLEGRNCRGGFDTEELDDFIPGWREELSSRKAFDDRLETAEARNLQLEAENRALRGDLDRALNFLESAMRESGWSDAEEFVPETRARQAREGARA